jgi:hypothetical protein
MQSPCLLISLFFALCIGNHSLKSFSRLSVARSTTSCFMHNNPEYDLQPIHTIDPSIYKLILNQLQVITLSTKACYAEVYLYSSAPMTMPNINEGDDEVLAFHSNHFADTHLDLLCSYKQSECISETEDKEELAIPLRSDQELLGILRVVRDQSMLSDSNGIMNNAAFNEDLFLRTAATGIVQSLKLEMLKPPYRTAQELQSTLVSRSSVLDNASLSLPETERRKFINIYNHRIGNL